MDGKYVGPHSQKQPRPVMNYYIVDARKGAGEDANVSRQPSSALHFTIAVDFAPRTDGNVVSMLQLKSRIELLQPHKCFRTSNA